MAVWAYQMVGNAFWNSYLMFYVCGNISLVVQCSLVLVKSINGCCKDIQLHVAIQIQRTVRHLRQNLFKYSYLLNSSQLIYWKINKGEKQERNKAIKEGHFSAIP